MDFGKAEKLDIPLFKLRKKKETSCDFQSNRIQLILGYTCIQSKLMSSFN